MGTLLGPEETGPFAWPLLVVVVVVGLVFFRAGLLPYRPGSLLVGSPVVGGLAVGVRVFGGGVGWLSGCCL